MAIECGVTGGGEQLGVGGDVFCGVLGGGKWGVGVGVFYGVILYDK